MSAGQVRHNILTIHFVNYQNSFTRKNIMSVITILLTLLVVGVLLWLVNEYLPMDEKIKRIFNIVVVIFVVLWLLKAVGLLSYFSNIKF